MLSRLDYMNHLREVFLIDPYHQEVPCWCTRCKQRWSIYRAPGTAWIELHSAAYALHVETHFGCAPRQVHVGNQVPYGASAPARLEEHDDSPSRKGRKLSLCRDTAAPTYGPETVSRRRRALRARRQIAEADTARSAGDRPQRTGTD